MVAQQRSGNGAVSGTALPANGNRRRLTSYRERLLSELGELSDSYAAMLESSVIAKHDWPSGFIGFPPFHWAESSPELHAERMRVLGSIEAIEMPQGRSSSSGWSTKNVLSV
jgi:hypothetical protein